MKRRAGTTEAVRVTPEIERLAEAVRGGAGTEGADRALEAFRAAFGATGGAGTRPRTRRRDDWRPGRRSTVRVPLRVALGAAVAGVALGGVALAAGSGMFPGQAGPGEPEHRPGRAPGVDAPRTPTGNGAGGTPGAPGRSLPSPAASGPATVHGPPDHAAPCHAWEKRRLQGSGRRPVDAAGGEGAVEDHCARAGSPAPAAPAASAAPGRPKEDTVSPPARGRSGEHGPHGGTARP